MAFRATTIRNVTFPSPTTVEFDQSVGRSPLTYGPATIYPYSAGGDPIAKSVQGVSVTITTLAGSHVTATITNNPLNRTIVSTDICENDFASTPAYFNIQNYGAVGDGVTNDTAAVLAAINGCILSGGGIVFAPKGTYLVSPGTLTLTATVQLGNVSLIFEGEGNYSVFKVSAGGNFLSSPPLNAAGTTGTFLDGVTFRDFRVEYAAQSSSGSVFDFGWGRDIYIERVKSNQSFNFLTHGSPLYAGTTIQHLVCVGIDARAVKGTFVTFNGQGGSYHFEKIYSEGLGAGTTSTVAAWGSAGYIDVMYFGKSDFESYGVGINCSVTSSGLARGMTDCFFEQVIVDAPVTGSCLTLSASGNAAAVIARNTFRDMWLVTVGTSGARAVAIAAGTGGKVEGNHFYGGDFQSSGAGSIAIAISGNGSGGSIVRDNTFDEINLYGSETGVSMLGCDDFALRNSKLGVYQASGGTTGVSLGGTTNSLRAKVKGNTVANYTTPISGYANLGAGSEVRDNRGFNPLGTLGAPAVPASGVAIAESPLDRMFHILGAAGGGTTAVINGSAGAGAATTIPANTAIDMLVPAASTMTPTYGGGNAPTWTVTGL